MISRELSEDYRARVARIVEFCLTTSPQLTGVDIEVNLWHTKNVLVSRVVSKKVSCSEASFFVMSACKKFIKFECRPIRY